MSSKRTGGAPPPKKPTKPVKMAAKPSKTKNA
jgi:hypothetical protein